GLATGLPVSSSIVVGGSPISASGLRDQDSTSARLPISFTLAPTFLISIVAHQSTSSARLPCPSGFTLIIRRPALASGLHSSGFASSLWLHWAPHSLQLHRGPQSFRLHWGPLNPRLCLGCQSRWNRHVPPDPQHCLGSSALRLHPGVASPLSTMAPPSIAP
ncbi:hypothetical protein PO909_004673, partial [Leuciscus waleckii]